MANCSLRRALTIGSFVYDDGYWKAVPATHHAVGKVENGVTCRKAEIEILCDAADWRGILSVYQTWRDSRIQDEIDAEKPEEVGSTVSVSFITNGLTWSARCYFLDAPKASTAGGDWVTAQLSLIDADEYHECLKAVKDREDKENKVDYFGTYDLWGTELKLREPPDTYDQPVTHQLSAAGVSYLSGPKQFVQRVDLVGDTDLDGWNQIYVDYAANVVSNRPESPFPVTAPRATATKGKGDEDDIYTVTISCVVLVD